jgi:hypothetical protein
MTRHNNTGESKMTTLTHRRTNDNINTGHVVLFAEEGNEHYGEHVWTLNTELPRVTDELVAWAAEYYETDLDEARELVDPDDIVNTAGAWDDPQFVSELWQAMEYNKIEMVAGYRTYDGAVVVDVQGVELTKSVDAD